MASVYYQDDGSNGYTSEGTSVKNYTMTKVFGWMFYAILVTAIVAFALPYGLVALGQEEMYAGILIAGVIATIILSFVSHIVITKTKSKPLAITVYTLFALSMGIWISPLVVMFDAAILGYSLFVTAGSFGIMAVYGAITKKDLNGFGALLIALLFGIFIASIVNIFVASSVLDWIISYIILGIYLGFVAFDVQRVKKMCDNGECDINSSLIMAMNLYIDFVYIFIRIVYIIAKLKKD